MMPGNRTARPGSQFAISPDVLSKEFDLPANLEPISNILVVGYSGGGRRRFELLFAAQRIP